MLNIIAKCLLVSTSLAPVLFVMAVNQFERGISWKIWIWWIVVAIVLVLLCWGLLMYAAKNAQKNTILIKEFESKNQETLTFLFIYLLPLLRSESLALYWITSLFVLSIILLAIVYTGAFHFNPVMRVFGYHFYSVKNSFGVSSLLISKTDFQRSNVEVTAIMIARNVHLHIGDNDAS